MPKITDRLGDAYARLFARPRMVLLNKGLYYLAARGLGIFNLRDFRLSGESYLLRDVLPRRLAGREPLVVDVGANAGDWSLEVLSAHPNATIHAYEPNPEAFAELSSRLGGRAHLAQEAMGASEGSASLNYEPGQTRLSSIYDVPRSAAERVRRVEVRVSTLDGLLEREEIEYVDLVKIDVEGAEWDVLQGADASLRDGRIGMLQFEFNEMNVSSRHFLADFIDLLADYHLYRLLPGGLNPIEPYSPFFAEVFGYQNIVAVRRTLVHHSDRPTREDA